MANPLGLIVLRVLKRTTLIGPILSYGASRPSSFFTPTILPFYHFRCYHFLLYLFFARVWRQGERDNPFFLVRSPCPILN